MPVLTLSTTEQELVPKNTLRKSVIFQNEDTAINVFVKIEKDRQTTVSATDHDHRIGPGAFLALSAENDGKEQIEARWTVIAASGSPLLSFFETEDVRR